MKKKLFILFALIIFSTGYGFCFEERTLKNGQRVIVEQVENNPIVIIDTWINTGSINENDENTGVSHFLEHLLFKGSEKYKTGEFDKILESKGGIVNATTSKDFTHYYIQIPSKHFDKALDLHADMLLHPLIPDNELEKERKVVLEEISKDMNNPDNKVYENFIKTFYTHHPYKRKVIGTKEVIKNITKNEIFEYYNRYYIPQNMITIVVGDINPEYAFSEIEKIFDKKYKYIKRKINQKEKAFSKQVTTEENFPINSGYMIIGWRVPDIKCNDNYALDVLSTILADGRSSILYQNIKEGKNLAYGIDASNSTYKEDGMFLIDTNFLPENLTELKEEIFKEVNNIIMNGVTDSQTQLAKKLIEYETKYSRESIANIASQLGYTTILTDDTNYYRNYLKNINKVTTTDIQRVAKKYLSAERSVISIVLPENFTLTKKNDNKEKPYKYEFVKETDGIKKYILDNKATLLINKNATNDIIAISVYAKGGNFLEKIPTTSNLMASTMLKGTKKYSKTELAKYMEENGIKISPTSGNDAFTVNIITTDSQLSKTLELMNEIFNNATFSEDDILTEKNNKLNLIKQSEDIPINIALDGFRAAIFGESPYSIANNKFIINYPKIRRDEIVEYYKEIFSAQNLVISINGNVDIEDVATELSRIFKPSKSPIFEYKNKQIPTIIKTKQTTKTQKNLETAWLFTGWQTCGILNRKDYATLTIIDSLLGSGMSSRLFVNLREREGLAYQIGSSYAPKMLRGAFLMYIGTNPETLEKAKLMMLKEIEKLKTEPISNKELKEAKEKVLGRYFLSKETNLDKASQTGWYEASGRGFDFEKTYKEIINEVTKEDIIKVAKKYFNSNNVISIIKKEE